MHILEQNAYPWGFNTPSSHPPNQYTNSPQTLWHKEFISIISSMTNSTKLKTLKLFMPNPPYIFHFRTYLLPSHLVYFVFTHTPSPWSYLKRDSSKWIIPFGAFGLFRTLSTTSCQIAIALWDPHQWGDQDKHKKVHQPYNLENILDMNFNQMAFMEIHLSSWGQLK